MRPRKHYGPKQPSKLSANNEARQMILCARDLSKLVPETIARCYRMKEAEVAALIQIEQRKRADLV